MQSDVEDERMLCGWVHRRQCGDDYGFPIITLSSYPVPGAQSRDSIIIILCYASCGLYDMCLLEVAVEWHKGPVSKVPTVKVA